MNLIETKIAEELNLKPFQVENAVKLIDEGNTIPFIARYRKEQTGELSDVELRELFDKLTYLRNLEKRKEEVIRLIDEQGKLDDELKSKIETAVTMTEVEDLYRPYKQKKRTRATIALEKGLKPLADLILEGVFKGDIKEEASKYIDEEKKVLAADEAINGALDIVAEVISDDAGFRKWIRELVMREGKIESKGSSEEPTPFEMYYEYSEDVNKIPAHRILAINRGEKEKVLSVKIVANEDKIITYLQNRLLKNNEVTDEYLKLAIKDSLKRLIYPSIDVPTI